MSKKSEAEEAKKAKDALAGMMVFNPERTEFPGVWANFGGNIWAKLRPLDKDTLEELTKKATSIKRRYVGHRAVEDNVVNDGLLQELIMQHIFEDWAGVVDPQGKPVPCSREAVAILTKHRSSFTLWGSQEADAIADDYEIRLAESEKLFEKEIKNLTSSPGGSVTNQQA